MPEVTLRAYAREIDELIEREQLEEAIAHCRHILQTYPKHLETYRHLGKAYLEAKRYGDAADIFQRVLSAVPDDFVSHIGMAIVREDEGNLDAAIWHMERAFETNPSNPAIQQEMKRLIERRDGMEPHKVRLTRGALARMYAHGELYTQAIAELRSALQEDPDRPDLQVLLAEMYWQTDQRKEATSVANRVLEKLPYCMQANRILAANLQAKNRVEEAAVHHRRLAGLDPYAAFVESATADPATIEASAVSVERFEWQPGAPMPDGGMAQPGWAATLGMEMKQTGDRGKAGKPELPQTGPLPSWLEPGEPPPFEASEQDEVDPQQPIEPEPEEDPETAEIEWLREEADMVRGAGEPEPGESEEDFMRELGESGDIPPEPSEVEPDESGEIPDWMQEAGWTEASGEAVEQPVSFSDAELRSLEAGELPAEAPPPSDEDAELAPADLPDWMQGMAPEEGSEPVSEEPAEASGPPDWLAAGDDEQDIELTAAEAAGMMAEQPPTGSPAESREEVAELADESEPDFPAAESADQEEPSFPAAEQGTEDLPTWITEEAPGATDTIVTWLGGQDQAKEEAAEDELDELPEWMKDTGPLVDKGDGGIGIPSPTEEPTPIDAAPAGDDEPPDWMEGILDSDEEQATPTADQPPPQETDTPAQPVAETGTPDLPGWLSAVAEVAAADDSPGTPESADEPEPSAPVESQPPAGTFEAAPHSEEDETHGELTAETQAQMEPESAGDEADDGAEEEQEELTPAEPPDWLSEAMGEPPTSVDIDDVLAGSPEPAAELADVEPPSWMEDEDEGQEPDSMPEPSAQEATQETPDWLKGLADEGTEQTAAERAADAPDWLREIAEPEAQATADSEPIEEQPEAMASEAPEPAAYEQAEAAVDSEAVAAEPPAASIPEPPTETPAAIDAEGQAAETDFPAAAETVSSDMETPPSGFAPPDWLQSTGAAAPAQPPREEPSATPLPSEPPGEVEPSPEPMLGEPEGEAAPSGPAAPEWLSGIADEVEAESAETAPDWLGDIGSQPADEPAAAEGAADWLGDIGQEEPGEAPAAEGVPDWLGDIGQEEEPTPARGQAPEWLSGLGDEPAPPAAPTEPSLEMEAEPTGPTLGDFETQGTPPEDVDDEVISWLEDLAAAQEETEIPETIHQGPEAAPEAPVMEQREIPEEPEEGLEWLEQLAEQRGLDVDVSLPEAATTQPAAPAMPEQADEPEPPGPEDSAPDWLTRMATQPLPRIDMDAIEAAATQQPVAEPEAEQPAVDPGAETIRKRADELELPDAPVERPAEGELVDEDEMPEWLAQAASQEQAAAEQEPAAGPPPEAEVAPPVAEPAEEVPAEPTAEAPVEAPSTPEPAAEATVEPEPAPPTAGAEPAPAAELPAVEPAQPEPAPAAEAPSEPIAEVPAEAAEAAPEPSPEPAAEVPAEEPAPEPPAPEPAKPKPEQTLDTARQELAAGDFERAIELYTGLIKRKTSLDTVIEDLRMAVDRTPDNAALWQTLGDAYMKNDQSAEAIDAYRKGMEVA